MTPTTLLPYPCPYCHKQVMLWDHLGNCMPAAMELDPKLAGEVAKIRSLTPPQLEAQIGQALTVLTHMYVKQYNCPPDEKWITEQVTRLRANAKLIRGEK